MTKARALGSVVLLLMGCAGHLPPCPASGGPAWSELTSRHFRLRTDEAPADARTVLRDLEQLRAAVLTAFGAPTDLETGRLPVVVVDRGWGGFADPHVNGMFMNAVFQPLVVMQAVWELEQQETIKHELVHYFSRLVMPAQPAWFAEGLASTFQTLEVDAAAGRVTLGRPPAGLLSIAQHRIMRVEEMMSGTGGVAPASFYATAWLAVHYLMNHHAKELARYQAELRDATPPAEAWTRAFGALTPAKLEWELRGYVEGGRYELLIFRFAPPAGEVQSERALPDPDVHATRALLYEVGTRAQRQHVVRRSDDVGDAWRVSARHEIDEALRQEPGHLYSQAVAHWQLGLPIDLAQARLGVERSKSDWLAWALLSEALRQNGIEDGQLEVAHKAIELARADPSVTLNLPVLLAH